MAEYIFAYALAFVLLMLVASPLTEVSGRKYSLEVYALLLRRPWIIAKAIPALAGVVAALAILYWLSETVPGGAALRFSWLSLLSGGEADPRGSASDSPVPEGGTNIVAIPLGLPYVAPVFAALLVAALPPLARAEERAFRRGTDGKLDALKRSIIFGLAHCLMGVPLFVGLALAVGGLYFSRQYTLGERHEPEVIGGTRDGDAEDFSVRRPVHREGGGVGRATVHHTGYNLLVLGLGFVVLILGWLL